MGLPMLFTLPRICLSFLPACPLLPAPHPPPPMRYGYGPKPHYRGVRGSRVFSPNPPFRSPPPVLACAFLRIGRCHRSPCTCCAPARAHRGRYCRTPCTCCAAARARRSCCRRSPCNCGAAARARRGRCRRGSPCTRPAALPPVLALLLSHVFPVRSRRAREAALFLLPFAPFSLPYPPLPNSSSPFTIGSS